MCSVYVCVLKINYLASQLHTSIALYLFLSTLPSPLHHHHSSPHASLCLVIRYEKYLLPSLSKISTLCFFPSFFFAYCLFTQCLTENASLCISKPVCVNMLCAVISNAGHADVVYILCVFRIYCFCLFSLLLHI